MFSCILVNFIDDIRQNTSCYCNVMLNTHFHKAKAELSFICR